MATLVEKISVERWNNNLEELKVKMCLFIKLFHSEIPEELTNELRGEFFQGTSKIISRKSCAKFAKNSV